MGWGGAVLDAEPVPVNEPVRLNQLFRLFRLATLEFSLGRFHSKQWGYREFDAGQGRHEPATGVATVHPVSAHCVGVSVRLGVSVQLGVSVRLGVPVRPGKSVE